MAVPSSLKSPVVLQLRRLPSALTLRDAPHSSRTKRSSELSETLLNTPVSIPLPLASERYFLLPLTHLSRPILDHNPSCCRTSSCRRGETRHSPEPMRQYSASTLSAPMNPGKHRNRLRRHRVHKPLGKSSLKPKLPPLKKSSKPHLQTPDRRQYICSCLRHSPTVHESGVAPQPPVNSF